ncbi:methylmalonyl Co-A mutase-associated GTPase MeaB [Chondromyces apiculatus]|uniref:Putative periplasmic protein kinase ArgK n=1 Tax=Chondromyces apiculatus DSM 436 TaxID=1192034 RepID=A0A017T4Z1_9BACT|nr:methylmalonyl Co-A mutase-associated GTPase MeaB [Chondromyces apiculatus]EYF04309.1 putative periplasmic protein kinase ArgK [Chondromyces apiculatus DSM 436]
MTRKRPRLALDEYERGVRACDRAILAQAITLVESRDEADAALAQALLIRLLPATGNARRVGITGVPGVGKSTFVDELGMRLLGRGSQVAVLAIDPSSTISGGSILGDKTRMARLSLERRAFIRPSPSGLSPGGIARRTRETMLLCEAAGFDVILVETVGVGQGETAVSDMVDFFLVLALPGSGDELQGIKKGILELADAIAVNKCDGDGAARARTSLGNLRAALRYLPRRRPSWEAHALAVSGLTGEGLDALWDVVEEHRRTLEASGDLAATRAEQQRSWMWSLITERLERTFRAHPGVARRLAQLEADVVAGRTTPPIATDKLFAAFALPPDAAEPATGVKDLVES